MPVHIPIDDQSSGAQEVDVRTPGQKRRDTILAKDPDFYKRIGGKGGDKGGRPFRDIPGLATKAVKSRRDRGGEEKR